MSQRLQVLLSDEEMADLRERADRAGVTVSEWVRQSLRAAHRQRSSGDVERRLGAVRVAAAHDFPAPDIEVMLLEIEHGYLA